MPPRVSRQAIGVHIGRFIFQDQAKNQNIAKRLESVPRERLRAVMERKGLKDMTVDKMSAVLSGKDRAGVKQRDLKQMVEVLQEVGIAKQTRAASQMVQTAAHEIQKGRGLRGLEDHGRSFRQNLNNIGAQRALEEGLQRLSEDDQGDIRGLRHSIRAALGIVPLSAKVKAVIASPKSRDS